jgi:hypothetical protein
MLNNKHNILKKQLNVYELFTYYQKPHYQNHIIKNHIKTEGHR